MAREADAFIGLPGGYGTLEELLEVISGAQLNIHRKPVGLLNVDGFFNSLLSLIDKAVDEGFISPVARRIVVSAPTPKQLLTLLEPKYIQALMKKQEQRQREQDMIYERKIAKERSKEDHLYAGKDEFVTSAYKKKLVEQEKWMKEEQICQLREEKEDVSICFQGVCSQELQT